MNAVSPAPRVAAEPRLSRRVGRRLVLTGATGVAAAAAASALAGPARAIEPEAPVIAERAREPELGGSADLIADPRRRAAHLLRRAGFGGSAAEIETFASLSREAAADRLLDDDGVDNSVLDARLASFVLDETEEATRGRVLEDMQRWWLSRMAYSAHPLEERMTLIWHGLLTSQVTRLDATRVHWLLRQNALFRQQALGVYDDLVQAVSKDPAMMAYLDTISSDRRHPNENYARELMELFTMGIGNYTEADVREAARAFTGWRVTPTPTPTAAQTAGLSAAEVERLRLRMAYGFDPDFRLDASQHDTGSKTFLGQTGAWDGEDIVRIIMAQPATGRFIATRLFRELAYEDPAAETVDRLVDVWNRSGHSVRAVVRAILVSDEFNSERAYRGKVRGPVEFVVGLFRGLELDGTFAFAATGGGRPARNGAQFYVAMGQLLFEPPGVAGWETGEAWLSSGRLIARANVADQVFFPHGQPLAIPVLAEVADSPAALLDAVLARLVDGQMGDDARASILAHLETIADPTERAATAAYLVACSPEYQLV
jgi:uncharacterized protein (DUF1800 family)